MYLIQIWTKYIGRFLVYKTEENTFWLQNHGATVILPISPLILTYTSHFIQTYTLKKMRINIFHSDSVLECFIYDSSTFYKYLSVTHNLNIISVDIFFHDEFDKTTVCYTLRLQQNHNDMCLI